MHRLLCGTVMVLGVLLSPAAWAQSPGTVSGTVTLIGSDQPVHGAVVLIVGPGLVGQTDEGGTFRVENVPPGSYEVLAQREHLTAGRQRIEVRAGETATVSFALALSPIHEEMTVTATGGQATTFEAFNAITTLDSFELHRNLSATLGEVLENEPGVARRSFGPGSSRPIIRGFDGDRVLMLEDGVRTGDLSSQSGDHGVSVDPNALERVEVVRGPATLIYGSNAIGGVVNAITPHESLRESLTPGTRAQLNADAGSANAQAGSGGSVQHTVGNFLVWAGGSSRRTGDYETPEGTVENSATRLSAGRAGVGYAGTRLYASGGVTVDGSRFGIPFAGQFEGEEGEQGEEGEEGEEGEGGALIDLDSLRTVGRFDLGMRGLQNRAVESFGVTFNVIDYSHDEIEIEDDVETIGTTLENRMYVLRADVNQRRTGRLSGRFGFSSQFRDYTATGAEALAPPTDQTAVAAFAYEELNVGRYRVQFGGRVERNAYTVGAREEGEAEGGEEEDLDPPDARDRTFTGASLSAGIHADLTRGTAFVANLTRSHRAPALEELYNFGPHIGNLAFEVGNPDLEAETTVGLDVSLRHRSDRVRGEANVYVYGIDNFVFLDVQDEIVDNLRLADFLQGDARFAGFDARGSVRLGELVWANLGLGFVSARLTDTDEALPRIPPFRGELSVDLPYRGLTVTPELVFAARQDEVFRDEAPTDGYSIVNVKASYVWPMGHVAHMLTVTAFNLTNELYRNHTSFIKDLAPEIGRGVKVGYSVRFF